MDEFSSPVTNLIDELARLPGVGRKSAQRLAFHIIKMPKEEVSALAEAIVSARENVRYCKVCGCLSDEEVCPICADPMRDHSQIMVVESDRDKAAYERTGQYKGTYHILQGVISPLKGVSPDDLKIRELLERLRDGKVKEVIIATNPSPEGDTTAMYLSRLIKPLGIKVSRIANGVPVGGNLEYVEHIRNFTKLPLVCAGRMTLDAGAEAIEEGKIDGVGIARQFLADPEWFTKYLNDQDDQIRPCIRCHNACFTMCHYKGVPNDQDLDDSLPLSRCAINAETMQKEKHHLERTKNPKKVIIVGGGIGGMEAARDLKLRGHVPVIYEKENHLGGVFVAASSESYKEPLRDLLTWYKNEMKRLNIEIHLNSEIKDLSSFGGNPVIIATGSKPRVLGKLPGHERMIEACDYLTGKKEVGKRVAVIGGGLTGCEIAYDLALNGHEVTIVEMKDDLISQKGVCLANSSYLREWFAWKKVPVYLETSVSEVKEGSVLAKDKSGKIIEIPCDSVISSVGYIPTPLAEEKGNVYQVGDCRHIGNLRSVIWRAYEVAMKI